MMKEAAEQFDKLCEISDIKQRMQTAVDRFSKGEISAKAIRLLYDRLSTENKVELLRGIYAEDVIKNNMERLPPSILMPEAMYIKDADDRDLAVCLKKHQLIYEYTKSKNNNKFSKLEKVLNEFWKNGGEKIYILSRATEYYIKDTTIKDTAIKEFIDDFLLEKAHDVSPVGLPRNTTIGVELEFVGIGKNRFENLMRRIPADFMNGFKAKKDVSVQEKNGNLGMEITSPVLDDTVESWKKLDKVCRFIRALGGRSNKTCGGHIHIGVNVLGVDTQAWENFSDIWKEAEPLIYMMSNRRGEKPRKGIGTYAAPSGEKLDCIEWGKVAMKEHDELWMLRETFAFGDRYFGFNPDNIGIPRKNTIEFRLPNGTVDYDILRENIAFFGKILKISKLRAVEPSIKQKEWEDFFEEGLEEKEKVQRFLDLVFNTEEEKDVYLQRWQYMAGEHININFQNKSYKEQRYPEVKKEKTMKEQIEELSKMVPEKDRIEAMGALIGKGKNISNEMDIV